MGVTMGVTRRVTLAEASRVLGISKEGVRKRVKRGKLRSDKGPDNRVYVYLPFGGDAGTPGPGSEQAAKGELFEQMEARITDLKDQLDQEREARRRADHIIAQLSQANAEMARTIQAIEPPTSSDRPPDSTETASETQGRGDVPDEPETVTELPWWRRWFGS